MNAFTYHVPTRVIFGEDTERQTGQAIRDAGGTKVLFICGGSALKSGLMQRIVESMDQAGLSWVGVSGVKPNPRLKLAQDTVDTYAGRGFDFVLGVGGGSVIDTAKAVAHGLARPDVPIWDYYSGKEKVTASLKKGVVLTIAAAGSEMSDSAVLTNEANGQKKGINTPFNQPEFAIMNPALTCTLPPRQTACGVADIMMHTMDRYFSVQTDNALTDGIAEALLRTVIEYGRVAMDDPEDLKARSEIMWCGSLSHDGLTGLGQPKDFSTHALGHELSGMFDIPHGESLTVMWPAWARYVYRDAPGRFARFGRNVWGIQEEDEERAALAAIRATERYFCDVLKLPVSFKKAIGVQDEATLRDLALRATYYGGRRVGQLHPMEKDELFQVYQLANH